MKNNKCVVRICGGIGNQLFSYAAARRFALKNDYELVIDDFSGFIRDYIYQRTYKLCHFCIPCRTATGMERLEPFSKFRRYIKRKINIRRPFEKRRYLIQEGIDFDSRLLTFEPKGTVYLEGYWQSEKYFVDVENVIRQDLRIIPPTDDKNIAMAELINNCIAVAVHVRFFDLVDELGGVNNTPDDYYKHAIHKMESLVPNAHFFIFSDRPEDAKARIPLNADRVTFVSHNKNDDVAFADLWLMTQCKHFIIANSTFSWWGAWLSAYKDKQVIAPGFEIRKGKMWWGFEGLLPDAWIKL